MNSLEMWFALAAAEVFFILWVLLFVSWVRNSAARRRDAKALRSLVAEVKQNQVQRTRQVETFLRDTAGLSGQPLETLAAAIVRGELGLVQQFALTYRRRDAARAAQFLAPVQAAAQPYWALGAALSGGAAAAGAGGQDAELRQDKERLSVALQTGMDAMSRMLSEYTGLFGTGEAVGTVPPAALAQGPDEVPDDPVEVSRRSDDSLADSNFDIGSEINTPPELLSALEEVGADRVQITAETPPVAGTDKGAAPVDNTEAIAELDLPDELDLAIVGAPFGGLDAGADPSVDAPEFELGDELQEGDFVDLDGLFDESAPDGELLSGELEDEADSKPRMIAI